MGWLVSKEAGLVNWNKYAYQFGLTQLVIKQFTQLFMKTKRKATPRPRPVPRSSQPQAHTPSHDKTHLTTKYPDPSHPGRGSLIAEKQAPPLAPTASTPRNRRTDPPPHFPRSLSSSADKNYTSPPHKKSLSPRPPTPKLKGSAGKSKRKRGCRMQGRGGAESQRPRRESQTPGYDKSEHENFLIRQSEERAITERREESEASPASSRAIDLQKLIDQTNNSSARVETERSRRKTNSLGELRQKIAERCARQFSFLSPREVKFYCAVVLVQRLWRQKKVRGFITDFIHNEAGPVQPRPTPRPQGHPEETSQLLLKYREGVSPPSRLKGLENERSQEQHPQPSSKEENERESPSSSSEEKAAIVRLVGCVRELAVGPQVWINNRLGLASSYSQKCLVHRLYSQIVGRKASRSVARSSLFPSPVSAHAPESPRREETRHREVPEGSEPQFKEHKEEEEEEEEEAVVTTQSAEMQTVPQGEVETIRELVDLSQEVLDAVLLQFTREYRALVSRSLELRKGRRQLPGLVLSQDYIRNYLGGLVAYALECQQEEMMRRYSNNSPLCYLKLHYDYEQEEEADIEQLEGQFNAPVLAPYLFYDYQQVFEQKQLPASGEQDKFRHFRDTLTKIGNLLLANCLSELVERTKTDRTWLPWEPIDATCLRDSLGKEGLEGRLAGLVEAVVGLGGLELGSLDSDRGEEVEEAKLTVDLREGYEWDWNKRDLAFEGLQLRLDVAEGVEGSLWEQLWRDIFPCL